MIMLVLKLLNDERDQVLRVLQHGGLIEEQS